MRLATGRISPGHNALGSCLVSERAEPSRYHRRARFVAGRGSTKKQRYGPGWSVPCLPGRSLCRAAFGQLGLFHNLFLQVSARAFRCVGIVFVACPLEFAIDGLARPLYRILLRRCFRAGFDLAFAGNGAVGRFRHFQLPFVSGHTSTFGMSMVAPPAQQDRG